MTQSNPEDAWSHGSGGLQKLTLQAADGACADIYAQGAHVTSWRPAGGDEQLFLSAKTEYRHGAAIRGGVPIIFPQFAGFGSLPKHGFARTAQWRYMEMTTGARATAVFCLQDDAATRALWPHGFVGEYAVSIEARNLTMNFSVRNAGLDSLSFTAALHTYLKVANVEDVSLQGLQGLRYLDTTVKPAIERIEPYREMHVRGEVDRIYFDAARPVEVREGSRCVHIAAKGFKDVVIWNPGKERGAALADLEAGGYRSMLCVEAATVEKPIVLAPNESWSGSQTLSV